MRTTLNLLILSVGIIFITSCKDDDSLDSGKYVKDTLNVNKELVRLMRDYYFWNNQIQNVNPTLYATPVELMEALKICPPDRWSYVTKRTELEAFYDQSVYIGFGFGSGFTTNNDLFITFTFKNSPLTSLGIDRGWQIVSIDGRTPTPNNYYELMGPDNIGIERTFVFKSPSGNLETYTIEKKELQINTVLVDSIYNLNSKKIGYFALSSFTDGSKSEFDKIFSKFKSEEIDELVVDLRYNGGGQTEPSSYLANLIGGEIASGKIFAEFYHNGYHVDLNQRITFSTTSNSLSINRVIFITSNASASASEMLINGLDPFVDVVVVGEKTQGNPVGMYIFTFKDPSIDWAFVPVCFIVRNAKSYGEYYEGLPVDLIAADDVSLPLGDINEASLNAALNYIEDLTKTTHLKNTIDIKPIVGKGLKAEIGAW